jgi:hypothetical protein
MYMGLQSLWNRTSILTPDIRSLLVSDSQSMDKLSLNLQIMHLHPLKSANQYLSS